VSLGTTYQVEQTYAKKYTLAATSSGSITVVSGPNGEEYYAEQEKVKHAVAHPDLVEKVASLPPSYAFSIQGVITSDLQVQPGSGLLMEAQSEKVYS
jgi:hypothetical protein